MENQPRAIKSFILKKIHKHPHDIVVLTATHFGVTRTTVHRHLNKLLKEKIIIKSGRTKNISYYSSETLNRKLHYKITPELSEFDVLKNDFNDIFSKMPENIFDICTYGFTEIFNNALDHSKGTGISAAVFYQNKVLTISIVDNGIGIFKNIYNYFKLSDIRESVLQLNKGKMTTDPIKHTGEGIFFSSHVFDTFEIRANQLYFLRDNIENDWSIARDKAAQNGTAVSLSIREDSPRNIINIFKKFQNPENLSFDRTEIIVELSKLGEEKLISRSQAKRITLGLEKFNYVTLDFSGVKLVGQGFVDEIFRVYTNAHPGMTFSYINANEDVEFMIKRSLSNLA